MEPLYSWAWVEAQVARTMEGWKACAVERIPEGRRFTHAEQKKRERAYDEALASVEREAKRARGGGIGARLRRGRQAAARGETGLRAVGTAEAQKRRDIQKRMTQAFARFAATALDLDEGAITLLTDEFLPVGTELARWARQFDAGLSMADIVQACRNAWTACGLQPLLGERVRLTPSILGYSLLYPYSDNFLDGEQSDAAKLRFSERFRERLKGARIEAANDREAAVWALVELIEQEHARGQAPQVYEALLAIHRAQERSLRQVRCGAECSADDLLRVSCAKGGTSVLADACLAQPWLSAEESRFAFEWGVLLQLGDDVQDLEEDGARGSMTLFSRASARGERLDGLVIQLLTFAERVGAAIDGLPHGDAMLKGLLRMSWRSLILMAVAQTHEHFSAGFLRAAEEQSAFRFGFLRERRERLAGRRGLYATLFELFLAGESETRPAELPPAEAGRAELAPDVAAELAAELAVDPA